MQEVALANKIKTLMIQNGKRISQKELSEKSGVTQATVSRILSGKIADPHIETIEKIANGLGRSASALMSESRPKQGEYISVEIVWKGTVYKFKGELEID